jgi:sugar/nucleoside kinase (ribokinase family)
MLKMNRFDLTFVGHMCYDEIVPFEGEGYIAPGSAVLQGAMAASRIGKKTAVVTRLAAKDENILESLRENGVSCFLTEADETSWMYVGHPSANVDEREMILKYNAGAFEIGEFPEIETSSLHMAGISNQEFTLGFIQGLYDRGYSLSVDLQSFVRQAHPETREVSYGDDDRKEEIVSLMQKVKLDVVEAEILTGTADLEEASKIIAGWGCPEVLITRADGVLGNIEGKILWEAFTNDSVVGRTGRGDTTFAGYLASRLDRDPEWSLKFAASLVSMKMERSGPFSGTLDGVLERMKTDGRI